jgi:signal transduction histidine kinase
MGFDSFRPGWDKVFPLPVVRLASDAVANAIERELLLERERTALAARLERSRRMQTIGSLASGIAHNFNNIIGAILGYSEMAEPLPTPGTKPAQHVDEIGRAAERIRPVQARRLFQEAATLLRATLPPSVELIIDDVPADIALAGEPAQLQQIILNLCTNAAHATDDGGHPSHRGAEL